MVWSAADGKVGFVLIHRSFLTSLTSVRSYVATYIGRPLAICENDYDTPLPSDTSKDEEIWHIPSTDHGPAFGSSASGPLRSSYSPTAGRVMSTFTERARLSKQPLTTKSTSLTSVYFLFHSLDPRCDHTGYLYC